LKRDRIPIAGANRAQGPARTLEGERNQAVHRMLYPDNRSGYGACRSSIIDPGRNIGLESVAHRVRALTKRPKERKEIGSVRIGTSGWTYEGWRGPFYPNDLPKKNWLQYYATRFSTTEINGSFYRTPSLEAVRSWRDNTPLHFVFAWKASKFITHWKRLTAKCENSIALMETRLQALAPKTAVVLFQLPPHFAKDGARLESFLEMLPRRYRYTFEFRHKSWYGDDILNLLHKHDVALCLSDHQDAPAPCEITARHVYIRGHGPGGRYRGSYSGRTLQRWSDKIAEWRRQKRDVLVYFDNDQKAAAPKDALRLRELVRAR
jgi:uncharacterized protein YecE (DUF72 family)